MDHHPGDQRGIDLGGGDVTYADGHGPGGQGVSRGSPGERGRRTGWTTGACAAAAARAATLGLCTGVIPNEVTTRLPNGWEVTFAVVDGVDDGDGVRAAVIKDAGDDPDCTHGAHLVARVRKRPHQAGIITIEPGQGVGRVTRPGLGLEVGLGAINPVPRENIIANVAAAAGDWLLTHGLEVTISVPGGESLALKTLNPRLGILGGISILGTTGVVYPYSTSAFKAAVVQAIGGAVAAGRDTIALTTGRRTERFAMQHLPYWPEWSFIQMGDFVGAALDSAVYHGVRQVVVVAMGGKLAKMAQGIANTHAHKTALDLNRVAQWARNAGAAPDLVAGIARGGTVRFAVEQMTAVGLETEFYRELALGALDGIGPWLRGDLRATVLALDFTGGLKAWAGAAWS
ncbi:MAG: cobalt-precorrin-5B (C(1))-methyltransferase [Magnetococcales bacterium]|nr:cobalt-precorrin-5B (C(1))-methyltransferase [Magnetococcales bacterium]